MKGRAAAFALGVVIAAIVASGASASAATVWLCRPGLAHNPCLSSMTTTVIDAHGRRTVQHSRPAAHPAIDCFYVYPTVSLQSTTNANLVIDPQETAVAIDQASRFSSVCRVYAPMYPQLTVPAIFKPGGITAVGAATAYGGVLSAFRDYLAHDNHGRGIVFIGHSQGSSMLIPLLAHEVDAKPAVRKRLVSALLMGGNVTVKRGRATGGDFSHIAACHAATQTGCVVAYSSFDGTPPANSLFGRVGMRDQPVRPPRDGPPDPVRQPGRAHRRPRGAAPLLPEQHDPRDAGPRPGAHPADDAVGVVPGRVHGTVSFGRRRHVARRRAGHHSRRPPPGRDAVPRPELGPAPRRRQSRAREPRPARASRGGRTA